MTAPENTSAPADVRKLADCPFCGGSNFYVEPDEWGSGGQWVSPIHVGCAECKIGTIGDDEAEAVMLWNRRAARSDQGAAEAVEAVRDPSGETVCGFRVAAYRETHPEHGSEYGYRYSEHWSTPNKRDPRVMVERLFTEDQLLAALSRARPEAVEAVARVIATAQAEALGHSNAANAYDLTNNNGRFVFDEMARAALSSREATPARPEAKESIPTLANCGTYLAKDNKGAWHYLNHARQWCGYQGPAIPALPEKAAQREDSKVPDGRGGFREETHPQDGGDLAFAARHEADDERVRREAVQDALDLLHLSAKLRFHGDTLGYVLNFLEDYGGKDPADRALLRKGGA